MDAAPTATNSPAAPASAPAYDPAKEYDVSLLRTVEYPAGTGFMHYPRDHHIMSGKMCQDIADAISNAHPV